MLLTQDTFQPDFSYPSPCSRYFPSGLSFQQASPFPAPASHPGLLQERPSKYVIKAVCHKPISSAQLVRMPLGAGSTAQVSHNEKTSEPFSLSLNPLPVHLAVMCVLPAAGYAALASVTHLFLSLIRQEAILFYSFYARRVL